MFTQASTSVCIVKSLTQTSYAKFSIDAGALAARVGTDATYVRAVVGDRMYLIVQALTGVLASFIIGLVLEWRLALVMVATFPLLTVGAIYENIVLRGFSDETAKAQESASQVRGFSAFWEPRLVVPNVRFRSF